MASVTNSSHAFIGKGKVFMQAVIGGVVQPEFWVGVVDKQEFKTSITDQKELYEAHTGHDNLWDKTKGKKKTTVELNIRERRKDALALALQAQISTVDAGRVDSETIASVVQGQHVRLKHVNVSDVVLTDSQSQPLAEGLDYRLDSAKFGRLVFLKDVKNVPINVAYAHGKVTKYKPFTNDIDYVTIRTEGLNTAGQKESYLTTAFEVLLDPADAFGLINSDFDNMTLKGDCRVSEVHGTPYEYQVME